MLDPVSIKNPPVLVGKSEPIQRVFRLIRKAAAHHYPILIVGEHGTGKETVARWIHANGPWRNTPFITLDCAALEPRLASELFSVDEKIKPHTRRKPPATLKGATLFWDEVAELPLEFQRRLARALPEDECRPGDNTKRALFDSRLVASLSCDPFVAIREGKLREDLYFRLNVISITLPPLRERKSDIPLLAENILDGISKSRGDDNVCWRLSSGAVKYLLSYEWPGNIQELGNCLKGATVLSSGPVIQMEDLPLIAGDIASEEVKPLRMIERKAIASALAKARGDKQVAATMLGIGRTTLYRKIQNYGLKK